MKRFSFILVMLISLLGVSCSSRSDSSDKNQSIDGTYVYQDAISRSVVTVSDDKWTMKTQFGAPGYYGDVKHDSGKVRGKTLYHSGIIEYGKVSGQTLTLAGRRYSKQ